MSQQASDNNEDGDRSGCVYELDEPKTAMYFMDKWEPHMREALSEASSQEEANLIRALFYRRVLDDILAYISSQFEDENRQFG